jgi:hypothetical protein
MHYKNIISDLTPISNHSLNRWLGLFSSTNFDSGATETPSIIKARPGMLKTISKHVTEDAGNAER